MSTACLQRSTACWMMLTCRPAARRVPGRPAERHHRRLGGLGSDRPQNIVTWRLIFSGGHCSFLAVRCDASAPSAARRLSPRPRRSPASRRAAKGWRWALVAINTLSCGGAYRGYPVRMDFALAKALKDAGFPQSGKGGHAGPPHKIVWRAGDRVYCPTLTELIEACGGRFESLCLSKISGSMWFAFSNADEEAKGSTSSEAVARLWLALNKSDAP
jgi:hypothetical protein